MLLRTNRKLHGDRVAAEAGLDLSDYAQEVGAGTIHLVDEGEARDVVFIGLAPHCFGLRFDTADRAEYRHRAVQDTQGTLHFNGEVDVPGGIDDIDAVLGELLRHAGPETSRRRGGNRDAPLLLLLHPVHHGGAIVYLTDLVRYTGVVKDALGRGGLTRVNMGHDADIAIALDGRNAWHGSGS